MALTVYSKAVISSVVTAAAQLTGDPSTSTSPTTATSTTAGGTGFFELRGAGGADGASLGSVPAAAQVHGFSLDMDLNGYTFAAGSYAASMGVAANTGTVGVLTVRYWKRSSSGTFTQIGTGSSSSTSFVPGGAAVAVTVTVGSSVSFGAGDTFYVDAILQITTATATNYVAFLQDTTTTGTLRASFPTGLAFVLSSVSMSAVAALTVAGPGNLMTPLDLFLLPTASTTLPTTGAAMDVAAGSGTIIATRIATTTGRWWNVMPLGSTTPTNFATEPTFGSGDLVWIYESTAVEGKRIPAGSWTPKLNVSLSTSTATITLVAIVGIRHSGGTYTEIGRSTISGQAMTTTVTALTFPAISGAQTDLVAGDKLVVEFDIDVTVSGLGSTKDFRVIADSASHVITPGFRDWSYVGAVSLGATAGLSVGGVVTIAAVAAMTAAASLTSTAVVAGVGTVTMSATAGLTVAAGPVTVPAVVSMAALAAMTVPGKATAFAAVSMSATASLSTSGKATTFGLATMSATAAMTVGAVVTVRAAVTLSATAGLTAGAAVAVTGVTAMHAVAGMSVAATGPATWFGVVAMSAVGGMVVVGVKGPTGVVAMQAVAGLSVAAVVTVVGVVGAAPPTYLYQNTFEGGTDGAPLTIGNSGGASGHAFDAANPGTGATLAYDSTQAAHGSLSAKIATGATSTSSLLSWFYGATTTVGGRIYVRFTARTSTSLLARMRAAGGQCADIYLLSTGQLRINNAASVTVSATTASIPLNTWVRIEWTATLDAAAGQMSLSFYAGDSTTPIETLTVSGQNFRGASATLQVGLISNLANYGPFWLDDVAMNTTGDPIGPYSAVTGGGLVATAAMTVGAVATAIAAVSMSAVAGTSVVAAVTELAAVAMTADGEMNVGASVNVLDVVTLVATADLSVLSRVTVIDALSMAGVAGLSVGSVVTELAAVAMTAEAAMTAPPHVEAIAAAAMTATAALTVAGKATAFAAVMLEATAALTAASVVDVLEALLPMTAVAGLIVGGAVTDVASVQMDATSSMIATEYATMFALIDMRAVAGMGVRAFLLTLAVTWGEAYTAWSVGAPRTGWRFGDATVAWRTGILRTAWKHGDAYTVDEAAAPRESR